MIILFIRLASYIGGWVTESLMFTLAWQMLGPALMCTCIIALNPHVRILGVCRVITILPKQRQRLRKVKHPAPGPTASVRACK